MSYFLKKTTPSKKGLYLQIYETSHIPGKGKRNKSYKALGYVSELKAKGIADPIAYGKMEAYRLNGESRARKEAQIGDSSLTKNLGHFLLKSMLDGLDLDGYMDMLSSNKKLQFRLSDFVKSMIYAQVVNPGSKHNAFENVLPNIYGCEGFSYDQILGAVNYIGCDYQKFIELFNRQISKKFGRKVGKAYFDCTNYYFEVDLPDGDRQPGPSKESRHCPIISQALLLDEDQIPLAMSMFPGNESEKPEIRKSIEGLKQRFGIDSRIVQVADKGLNCARNIYAATVEAKDGYIFSKSVLGRNLSKEKRWVLLDDGDANRWTTVSDAAGKEAYRYKECIDTFAYRFDGGDGKKWSSTPGRSASSPTTRRSPGSRGRPSRGR